MHTCTLYTHIIYIYIYWLQHTVGVTLECGSMWSPQMPIKFIFTQHDWSKPISKLITSQCLSENWWLVKAYQQTDDWSMPISKLMIGQCPSANWLITFQTQYIVSSQEDLILAFQRSLYFSYDKSFQYPRFSLKIIYLLYFCGIFLLKLSLFPSKFISTQHDTKFIYFTLIIQYINHKGYIAGRVGPLSSI